MVENGAFAIALRVGKRDMWDMSGMKQDTTGILIFRVEKRLLLVMNRIFFTLSHSLGCRREETHLLFELREQ